MSIRTVIPALTLAIVLAACGSDDATDEAASAETVEAANDESTEAATDESTEVTTAEAATNDPAGIPTEATVDERFACPPIFNSNASDDLLSWNQVWLPKLIRQDYSTPVYGVNVYEVQADKLEASIANMTHQALTGWRPLLRFGGTVVFSEAVWLVGAPPSEVEAWWTAEYPQMSDRAGVQARIAAASYRTIGSFVLPAAAWWDAYYSPMQDRVADLRAWLPNDPVAREVAADADTEIDMFRRFSDCYSYEFFIVQPTG